MILNNFVSDDVSLTWYLRLVYHRFVKTTPNPRATKKSKGELWGPPPPPPELLAWDVWNGREEVADAKLGGTDEAAVINVAIEAEDTASPIDMRQPCASHQCS